MFPKKFWIVPVVLAVVLIMSVIGLVTALAQEEGACDIEALIEHQQEHAATLNNLEHTLHDDLDSALENLYVTGIAYQALAVNCGYSHLEEAEAEHIAEHETQADHADEDHAAAAILEAAMAIGNPENGEILFNELQPEVSFACATCHRVDSTERLIGPGLWGVGNPEHDPSEHDMAEMDMGGTTDHPEDEHGETETGNEMAMQDNEESDHAMDMGDSQSDDHMMNMGNMSSSDPVEYIRTSILDPSAFVVPSFPDNLMPKNYAEIFTEDEINDLIAYLLTLQ